MSINNPKTNRSIQIGGDTYCKLIKEDGYVHDFVKHELVLSKHENMVGLKQKKLPCFIKMVIKYVL